MADIKKRLVLLLILALAGGAIGYAWHQSQNQNHILELYGNVDIRTVNLSMRVSGKLNDVLVEEGDLVQAEQALARLDAAPYEHALAQAQAGVALQEAQLALLETGFREEEVAQVRSELAERQVAHDYAHNHYLRIQALGGSRAVAADDVEAARQNRDRAQAALQASRDKLALYEAGHRQEDRDMAAAQLQRAQAVLAQAQLDVADTTLYSPSEGIVMTRAVEPGTMLGAGSTVITLSLPRPIQVRAYVSGAHLHRAVPGTTVLVFTDGRPQEPYEGRIGFVSPTAEFTPKSVQTPELRTDLVYRIRILIEDGDESLRQGMPVTIRFP